MRSAGTPAASASATRAATTSSALVSHGSFSAVGARKRFGYQLWSVACGARNASPLVAGPVAGQSFASPAMSSAEEPRPCTRITAPRARPSGAPKRNPLRAS